MSKCSNEHKRSTRRGASWVEGDPLEIEQEIKIWLYKQMVWEQTRICPRKWDAKNSLGL